MKAAMKRINNTKNKLRALLIICGAICAFLSFFLIQRAVMINDIAKQIEISTPNGIESLEYVEIGGIKQAVLIRGLDVDNPILLVLHGGPGYPEIASQRGSFLEEYYTVVNFDQRLSGKTRYANDVKGVEESDSVEIRVRDVIELSEYLCERFDRRKITLYGVSWGSILGVHAVKERPDLFSAYIGVSQVSNHHTALQLAYEKALILAEESGNKKDIAALEKLAPYPGEFNDDTYYRWWRVQQITKQYTNTPLTLNAGGIAEGFWPQCYSPYYSLREALYFPAQDLAMLTGAGLNEAAAGYMFDEFDLRNIGLDYDVPIILSNGEFDWVTPPILIQDVFDDISAPYKSYHIYSGAGHGYNQSHFFEIMTNEAYGFALDDNN